MVNREVQYFQCYRLSHHNSTWLTYLVDGGDPLCSYTGSQCEDGQILALHPARLQTVLPLSDHPRLRVGVVRDPEIIIIIIKVSIALKRQIYET